LLTHDDDLVPVRTFVFADSRLESACGIYECIAVTPDKVDFAKLGQQVGPLWLNRQRAINEICGLIVKTVGHVEIGLCDGIGLVEINSRFTAERVFE